MSLHHDDHDDHCMNDCAGMIGPLRWRENHPAKRWGERNDGDGGCEGDGQCGLDSFRVCCHRHDNDRDGDDGLMMRMSRVLVCPSALTRTSHFHLRFLPSSSTLRSTRW